MSQQSQHSQHSCASGSPSLGFSLGSGHQFGHLNLNSGTCTWIAVPVWASPDLLDLQDAAPSVHMYSLSASGRTSSCHSMWGTHTTMAAQGMAFSKFIAELTLLRDQFTQWFIGRSGLHASRHNLHWDGHWSHHILGALNWFWALISCISRTKHYNYAMIQSNKEEQLIKGGLLITLW